MNDYGSLRRRTRDAGWQWTLMGVIIGLGLAMVVCVGAYAVGAISLSIFEEEGEPETMIVPNETEVAMQAGLQQTLAAQQATIDAQQATLDAGGVAPVTDETPEAGDTLDDGTGEIGADQTIQPSPTMLPSGDTLGEQQTDVTLPTEDASGAGDVTPLADAPPAGGQGGQDSQDASSQGAGDTTAEATDETGGADQHEVEIAVHRPIVAPRRLRWASPRTARTGADPGDRI